MRPNGGASIVSAFGSWTLTFHDAFGRSKSSRENQLVHAHAALLQLFISCVSSPSSLITRPRYRNLVACACFWPSVPMTSGGTGGVGGSPSFGGSSGTRIKRLSVFFSDVARPKAPNTSTTAVINHTRMPSGDLEASPASSAYSIPHTAFRARSSGAFAPIPVSSPRYFVSLRMTSSSLNPPENYSSSNAFLKEMLNSSGDSTRPCRGPE